ncbi:hypothetical protein PGSY75_1411000 [Plasmodium gaboni]|uniref:Uncharacterized protein n=1 Tax=Plasmodium gaboni TaxID=647221 RepID=A0A151L9U2_9APIC|nr:hypothetical protein PGSY75_1411000 [Plasmodium gaboni]KYN95721.1 hypothetical protein PGSY75_1411000 [Plasmodium gaboni]
MEIKLNTKFDEILLIVCDKHVIENHEKFFVDKYEKVMCVECLYKFLFKKYPLYKKYLLFKSINNLFCIKACEEFRYHFSFYLLDHTLFLSEAFSYIEGISQFEEKEEKKNIYSSNYNNENIKNNDNSIYYDNDDDNYIYLVNSELIKLTTNACKEFLYKCSKELCNIFKDAIYTCVLVRLKNFSSKNKKRNFFFLLDFLKSLIDNVEIIFVTLKDESTIIEELMKLFIENDEMINSKLTNNNYGYIYEYNAYTDKYIDKKKQNNKHYYNSELLLNLQIIYKLWHDNLLWQINNNLLKRFFIYLITKFKYTNKNTDLCTYYIQFIYLITLQYNVLNYFFHHIIFDSSPNSNIKTLNIENNNKRNSNKSSCIKHNNNNNNFYSVNTESNNINNSNTNSSNNNSVEHYSNSCQTSSTCITKIKKRKNILDRNILSIYNIPLGNKKNEFTKEQNQIKRCFQINNSPQDIEDNQDVKNENSIEENEEKYKQIREVNKNTNEYMYKDVKKNFYYHSVEKNNSYFDGDENNHSYYNDNKDEYNSPTSNNSSIKSNIFFISKHDLIYSDDEKNVTHYPLKKDNICDLGEYEMESIYNSDNMSIRSEGTHKNKFSLHEKSLDVSKISTESKCKILSKLSKHFSFTQNSSIKEKENFVSSNCDNQNDNVSFIESSYTSYSLSDIDEKKKKKKKINLNKLEILENSHIFIILCDNLQETLLNHFNSDIQMKCLDIFYSFCSFDDNIVNIILTNTSLVEWVFDYISNTKYENLREKALKLLVTFFFNNTLFSNTHTHYAIDVLINIILRYVSKDNIILNNKVIYTNDINNNVVDKQFIDNSFQNKVCNNNAYDHYSNKCKYNFFTISYIIKALNMLINISHASIKISHIFKIINIFSCLIISPSCTPTNNEDIILLFESILLKNNNNNNQEILFDGKLEDNIYTQENERISCKLKSKEKNENINNILHMDEKCDIYINTNTFNGTQKIKNENLLHKKKKNLTMKKNNISKNNYKNYNNGKGDTVVVTLENNLLNDIINKVYITNIFILFKILKTALNIIKTVNIYKKDIYIEIIYNEEKNYIQNITISIMKLLFCLVYILNRNEEFFIDLNIINDNEKLDNEHNFQRIAFIKLMLSFFIELDIFMENIFAQNSNIINQEKKLYNIQFTYLTCIFIIHNVYKKKQVFNNISWNILFSSFFNHFYNLLTKVLCHVDDTTQKYLKEYEQINKSKKFININNSHNETGNLSMSPKCDASKEGQQKKEKRNNHHNNNNDDDVNSISCKEQHKLIIDKFVVYKKRIRKELLSNKPFTLFFQYVSRKNYSEECHRILKLLIDEEETIIHERDDIKDILIDIIKKNDFYFSNVLLFNFNDNEVVIETVIYIFYLSLKYDKVFLERKLNKSKKINYVQHIFVTNNYNNNINPLFLFMSLTYSYYFIKKDKIYIAFEHIQNQLYKINLRLWKDIKKLKNIYLAFDCIFSLNVDNNNYNSFFLFIIYIIKLELSLYASGEISEVDNKLYLSISKNRELINMIFEHIEMDNILNDQIIYVYYLIIKLRKYSIGYCNKSISLYKMMNTVIRYMNTLENKTDEINNIFSFFFLFFENLEKYSEKDIFNIITLLQKLSLYVKYSLERFFSPLKKYNNNDNNNNDNNNNNNNNNDNNNNCYNTNDEYKMECSNNPNNDFIYNILKFENSFFYFLLNLIFYCRKYNQIQNINVLSSSISLIHLLIYSIKNTNTHFRSLSFYILSLLILPFPKSPNNISPLLIKLCTSFDKNIDEILSLHNNTSNTNQENKSDKCIVRKKLFYPLLTHESMEIRLSSLSLLLCLLLTNEVVLLEEEVFLFFLFLINSSFLSEWDNIQNDLLLAIINVLLLSTNINLKVKSFCFNYIYSFRPFFLRSILHLNRKQEIIIHRLFFLLMVVKIKPLWFDITTCSDKILKIIMNVVTRKNMDLFIFNCIISVAHETFIKEKNNHVNNNYNTYTNKENKNVIENLEEYLDTYKKNIKKNSDKDIYNISSFNKFKCENIDYDVVLSVLNTTTILLYK